MATFVYKAKDKKGKHVEGNMEADGRGAVVSRLQQMGYFPISITQGVKKAGKVVATADTSARDSRRPSMSKAVPKISADDKAMAKTASPRAPMFSKKKIKTQDIASFNRQVADLIGAGIPLVKALAILMKQTSNEKLKEVIADILDDVQGGTTLADSLKRHPQVFSKLYVAMVRSGETGGMLDEVLNRLADISEEEEQLRGKIKSALAYPVVMVVAGSIAVFVMFSYVIPKITGTFEQLGQALPAITQILITISHWTQNYWYLVIGGVVLFITGTYHFLSTTEGKAMWHRAQLKIPVLGPLIKKQEVARFTRTLGSLLRNGVSILSALDIVKEVVDNTVMKSEVSLIIEEITQGSSIAKPLAGSQIFPSVAVNMIAIGEETGRLPDVLIRISSSFEAETDRLVRSLTSLIEPLIIVAMGLVVGFIVIAMLLPIFSLDPTGGM